METEINPWVYVQSGEFWATFLGSAFLLLLLRLINWGAVIPIRERGVFRSVNVGYTHPGAIIWIGATPLVHIGQPSVRFLNPKFYLGLILIEPLSVLPWPIAGWFYMAHEWETAWIIASGAALWRIVWDLYLTESPYPRETRCHAVFMKLVWLAASGLYYACLSFALLMLFFMIVIVLAFLMGGGGPRRRRRRFR